MKRPLIFLALITLTACGTSQESDEYYSQVVDNNTGIPTTISEEFPYHPWCLRQLSLQKEFNQPTSIDLSSCEAPAEASFEIETYRDLDFVFTDNVDEAKNTFYYFSYHLVKDEDTLLALVSLNDGGSATFDEVWLLEQEDTQLTLKSIVMTGSGCTSEGFHSLSWEGDRPIFSFNDFPILGATCGSQTDDFIYNPATEKLELHSMTLFQIKEGWHAQACYEGIHKEWLGEAEKRVLSQEEADRYSDELMENCLESLDP